MKKKFIITLVIILLSPFIADFCLFLFLCNTNNISLLQYRVFARKNFDMKKFTKSYYFKDPQGLNYKNKPPIILFGNDLDSKSDSNGDKSFDKYLSDLTQRPVYNRNVSYGFIQHAIAQVQSRKLDNLIKHSSNAIYFLPSLVDLPRLKVYPGNILDANFLLNDVLYFKYVQDKNGNLIPNVEKHPAIKGSIIYRLIDKQKNSSIDYKTKKLFIQHLKLLKDELQKVNPQIKLSLIVYYDELNSKNKMFRKKIEQEGINVVYVSDLSTFVLDKKSEYYKNGNPTQKALETFTPYIVNQLGL